MKIIVDNTKLIARYNGKGNPKGYLDPDTLCDEKYNEKIIKCYSEATVEKGKNKKPVIRYKGYDFKPDQIVGWKQIRHAYEGKEGWIDAYINLFNCERIATVLWPAYMDDFQTINQNRGEKRFDFVLNDIKKYLYGAGEEDVFMHDAYEKNQYTKEWLETYIKPYKEKEKEKRFKAFINDMNLGCFVNDEYEVLNIEVVGKRLADLANDKHKVLDLNKTETANNIDKKDICKVTKDYLEGLIHLLNKS